MRGMTVTELVMALAVMSILASLAAPGLTRFLQSSAVTAKANEINAMLAVARSEALQRYDTVMLAPDGENWSEDWLVGIDANANGSLTGDEILHRMGGVEGGSFSFVDDDGSTLSSLSFDPRGWPESGASITYAPTGCLGKNKRIIKMKPTGDMRISKVDC